MNRSLSIYLDLLRFTAALGVFLYHGRGWVGFGSWVYPEFTTFGAECVAVFFVLSGFVIRYASVSREDNWRDYTVSRFARIYPVAVLAIVVTLIADAVGRSAAPGAYAGQIWFNPHTGLGDVASYLTFTNEVWWRHVVVGSDEPFWSLGYEVPYYLLFGLVLFAPGRWKALMAVAWALVVGPRIVVFLPLWLMGVGLFELLSRQGAPSIPVRWSAAVVFLASGIVMHAVRFWWRPHPLTPMQELHDLGQLPTTCVYFTVIGLIVAVNVWAFDRLTTGWLSWPAGVEKAIRWAAGGTFTLYLCHQPIMAAVSALWPSMQTSRGLSVLGGACLLALVFGLAEVAERRKRFFRRWIGRRFRARSGSGFASVAAAAPASDSGG